jgi:hypothetical protein
VGLGAVPETASLGYGFVDIIECRKACRESSIKERLIKNFDAGFSTLADRHKP